MRKGKKQAEVIETQEVEALEGPLSQELLERVVRFAQDERSKGTNESRRALIRRCLDELVLDNSREAVDQVDAFWLKTVIPQELGEAHQEGELSVSNAELTSETPNSKLDSEVSSDSSEPEDVGNLASEEVKEQASTRLNWGSSTRREIELAHSKRVDAMKRSREPLNFLVTDKESRADAKKAIDRRAENVLDACFMVDNHMQILLSTINIIEAEYPHVSVNEIIARVAESNKPSELEQKVLREREFKESESRQKQERDEKKANKALDRAGECEGQLSIYSALKSGTAEEATECTTRKLEEGEDVTAPIAAQEDESSNPETEVPSEESSEETETNE